MPSLKLIQRVRRRLFPPRRIEHAPFFKRHPQRLSLEMVDGRSAIDHDRRFAYFRIPKAANSTVVASLNYARSGMAVASVADLQALKDSGFAKLSDLGDRQVDGLESDYFKFTFVRNPYTRLLSAYLDKIGRNKSGRRSDVCEWLGKPADSEVSVDEFLAYLENGALAKDGHWAPQADLIPLPVESLHFVGTVERLADGIEHVIDRIFGKKSDLVNMRHNETNASTHTDLLNDDRRERIYRLYERDFDTFGYPKG